MRPFHIFAALTLLLSMPNQANAVLVSAPRKTQVPAFLEGGSESRIGLLCHNDPVNKSDPFGLEFYDLGYGFSDFVRGADYGITQPVLTAPQIILTPVNGGYTASVPKIDLSVRSTIATKARDGQSVFNRARENVDRTVKHEGDHREHNRGWYEKNHEKVLKDLNTDKVYKDPAAAKSAVEQKLQNNFENFRKQEDTHTGPNWPNYKRPDREHP